MENKIISLNDNWLFKKCDEDVFVNVNIPHTWNNIDGQDGGNNYYRNKCTYTRELIIDFDIENKVLMIEFKGVNASCDVYFNNELLTHHDGGYSAFSVIINKELIKNKNTIKVEVDNSDNPKIYPQKFREIASKRTIPLNFIAHHPKDQEYLLSLPELRADKEALKALLYQKKLRNGKKRFTAKEIDDIK